MFAGASILVFLYAAVRWGRSVELYPYRHSLLGVPDVVFVWVIACFGFLLRPLLSLMPPRIILYVQIAALLVTPIAWHMFSMKWILEPSAESSCHIHWHWVYWLFLLGGVILFFSSLRKMIRSFIRARKPFSCFGCGRSYKTFPEVSRFLCIRCGTVNHLGAGEECAGLHGESCDYCGQTTALALDARTFPCPDCGLPRLPGAPPVRPSSPCLGCAQPVPDGAIYCAACGEPMSDLFGNSSVGDRTILEANLTALGFDVDWMACKSFAGHLRFAC
jgi:predicted RNA-binding Zn-ribbon protein involved in translation (DUF1610 family)